MSSSVRVRCLGSGSSGNAIVIASDHGTIAVDCGLGPRALALGLAADGLALADLDAVLLTHEHADHVRALPTILKRRIPILCTAGTARAAGLPSGGWEPVTADRPTAFGRLAITPIPVHHDAAEPCGFAIEADGVRIVVATDLGCAGGPLADHLTDADLIAIEANHDDVMLRAGPYPERLKQRVLSDRGHLSNVACGALLARALRRRTAGPATIWLAHLSATNNRPQLAAATVQTALAAAGRTDPVSPLPRHGYRQVWHADRVAAAPRQLAMLFSL